MLCKVQCQKLQLQAQHSENLCQYQINTYPFAYSSTFPQENMEVLLMNGKIVYLVFLPSILPINNFLLTKKKKKKRKKKKRKKKKRRRSLLCLCFYIFCWCMLCEFLQWIGVLFDQPLPHGSLTNHRNQSTHTPVYVSFHMRVKSFPGQFLTFT